MEASEVSGKLEANKGMCSTCELCEGDWGSTFLPTETQNLFNILAKALFCLLIFFCLAGSRMLEESVLACLMKVKNVEGKDNIGVTSGG